MTRGVCIKQGYWLAGICAGFLSSVALALTLPVSPASAVLLSDVTGRTNTPNTTLNMRSCASTSCTVVRRIPHYTWLRFNETSGDWFRTSYGGATGWVHSNYTNLIGTSAATVSRGNISRRMVAYTFDAGADYGYTGQILNFLKANNIKADFGMTGKWAGANSTAVQRMANEGHAFINHTWSHGSFTGTSATPAITSPARRTEELVTTNNKIMALTNRTSKPLFRPPYGDYNSSVLKDIGANGYKKNVMWSVDSLGWKGLSATDICNRVVGSMDASTNGGNGYIILFHVGSQSQDGPALSCITSKLKARGFTFGTTTQVIAP